ncbi:MAG: hypothetical protein COB26_11240 [Piscirickettsiaceae bacterium]|nr:MAG: hypothetical protein COB89_01250 [Piscirickettsiaceae bacterium]PCI66489.1 MAG: hypothetical protein COB26_11240 [Piscirickettsiaceae bacterium]
MEHPIRSVSSLIKASLLATALAAVILITAVLPAEYGIDPTGVGEALGLMALAPNQNTDEQSNLLACNDDAKEQEDSVSIVIPAQSGLEYKFYLDKKALLEYSWRTDGAALYFDFHGEPQGDTTGYFKSYKEATSAKDQGKQIVPFTGSHGWYWKNESTLPIALVLKTKGVYKLIGLR